MSNVQYIIHYPYRADRNGCFTVGRGQSLNNLESVHDDKEGSILSGIINKRPIRNKLSEKNHVIS